MIGPGQTYRCAHSGQVLPFDDRGLVPEAWLRRCESSGDWQHVGPTDPDVRARAEVVGPVGVDGRPSPDQADRAP